MSLFVPANHMLVLYSGLYLIGDFLRAFFYKADDSADAVGISVLFFFLSIWLVLNSIIYYKAFLQEMEAYRVNGQTGVEGSGITSAHSEVTSAGEVAPPTTTSKSSNETFEQAYRRWTFYLRTEVGLAYFLNIVGSVGYVISSLISLFLTLGTTSSARDVDRASLFLDSVNMVIFIVDGFLFWHVWWKESDEPSRWKKMTNVYNIANFCNTGSSIGYFCFIVYALNARYDLQQEEPKHIAAGERGWYDSEVIQVSFRQRTMYFCADCIYLVYALLLEWGWYQAPRNLESNQLKSVRLQETTI